MMRATLLTVLIVAAATHPAAADEFVREDLRIPFAAAGPRGLEALLIRPAGTRRYPLALISHGAPREAGKRPGMTPNRFYVQAAEFARRGFAALVVMRRGYGNSGGDYAENSGSCDRRNYLIAAKASVSDLRAAIDAMNERGDVTTQGMIAVGVSAGGFASVALTADPPPGLAAADRVPTTMCAMKTRWCAPSLRSAKPRVRRCCGSTPRTTGSSDRSWRDGCTAHSPTPAAARSSWMLRHSAPTATPCSRQPARRSGRRWSMVSCASSTSVRATCSRHPPRQRCRRLRG
jgi:alpha/beta superfamily hydrolase